MSAFGGKADFSRDHRLCPLLTQSRHQLRMSPEVIRRSGVQLGAGSPVLAGCSPVAFGAWGASPACLAVDSGSGVVFACSCSPQAANAKTALNATHLILITGSSPLGSWWPELQHDGSRLLKDYPLKQTIRHRFGPGLSDRRRRSANCPIADVWQSGLWYPPVTRNGRCGLAGN